MALNQLQAFGHIVAFVLDLRQINIEASQEVLSCEEQCTLQIRGRM
jgi:hypothetical protein